MVVDRAKAETVIGDGSSLTSTEESVTIRAINREKLINVLAAASAAPAFPSPADGSSASMPQNCFHAVCAQGEYIYALYGPDLKNARTTLYKLDWEGNPLNKYLLDGLYVTCCATPDKLYLSGTGDNNMQVVAIYQLDIKNL